MNITGTKGDDTLYGSEDNDTLTGGAGNDSLEGYGGNDSLSGGAGNDYLYGNEGNDSLSGGAGSDNLYGNEGNDSLSGGAGNDYLYGNEGNDSLSGGAGNDSLEGYGGNDILSGGDGDDTISGGIGDTIVGGLGTDELYLDLSSASVDLSINYTGTGTLTLPNGTSFSEIERLSSLDSGSGNDTIAVTTPFDVSLDGRGGNDSLSGGAGDDRLNGDEGNDSLSGGAGNDYLYGGGGNDILSGGDRDDYIYGGIGDTIAGGLGTDELSLILTSASEDLSINYTGTGTFTLPNGTSFSEIERLSLDSGSGNDTIAVTTPFDVSLFGGDGNDSLSGGAGDDTLEGSEGNDSLSGGDGDDSIIGSNRDTDSGVYTDDQVNDSLSGGDGNDSIYGGIGDTIAGGLGTDELYLDLRSASVDLSINYTGTGTPTLPNGTTFSEIESLSGLSSGSGNDTIAVTTPFDVYLSGGEGNDSLSGGAGNDTLYSFDGNDSLSGGAGNDTLYSFDGNNTLSGGDGDDTISGGIGDTIVGGLGTDYLDLDLTSASEDLSINYTGTGTPTLPNGTTFSEIESLSGLSSGSGNDTIAVTTPFDVSLDGRGGNDSLSGGAGNDTLEGSEVNDTLTGGLGTDTFFYNTGDAFTTSAVGVDLITNDFVSGTDKIVLGFLTFSTLNATADEVLSASDFATINTGFANELSLAGGSSAGIVYNQFNGNLFYNQNGSIAGLETGGLFATLTGIPSLAATDFTFFTLD